MRCRRRLQFLFVSGYGLIKYYKVLNYNIYVEAKVQEYRSPLHLAFSIAPASRPSPPRCVMHMPSRPLPQRAEPTHCLQHPPVRRYIVRTLRAQTHSVSETFRALRYSSRCYHHILSSSKGIADTQCKYYLTKYNRNWRRYENDSWQVIMKRWCITPFEYA